MARKDVKYCCDACKKEANRQRQREQRLKKRKYGRTGRLAMNYLLVLHNYPPIVIHEEDRKAYYEALKAWDTGQQLDPLLSFLRQQTAKTWEKQIARMENRKKDLER